MASDALVALGVVATGAAILYTHWLWLDPAISLVISAVIVWGTWSLLREALALALAGVPAGVDQGGVADYLAGLPGVTEVHDLHIWGMSTTETALTAHLVRPGAALDDALLSRGLRRAEAALLDPPRDLAGRVRRGALRARRPRRGVSDDPPGVVTAVPHPDAARPGPSAPARDPGARRRQMFLADGYEAFTTRKLAARVGLSQTGLYVYFKSKEELLDTLCRQSFVALAEDFRTRRRRRAARACRGCGRSAWPTSSSASPTRTNTA